MRSRTKKYKKLFKSIQTRFTKNPLLLTSSIFTIAILLGSTTYGTYLYLNKTHSKNGNAAIVSQNSSDNEDDAIDIDTKPNEIAKTDSIKKASETKKDYSDPRAPTLETGAGCAGVACYAPANFSLVASPSVVKMKAGTTNVPVTIKTKDGSKVDWGGMPEDGGINGVSSFSYDTLGYSSSFTYYLEAKDRANGTYHLTFYARKESPTRQQATVTVTVKVTPSPYFTVNVGTATLINWTLEIPFTVNWVNGSYAVINAGGAITCPGNNPVSFGGSWTTSQVIQKISLPHPPSTPTTCKVKLDFSNTLGGNIIDDTVSFKVQEPQY